MKFIFCLTTLLLLITNASCSYEEKRNIETAVEQAVDKFHEQLRNQQYQEIYAQSAPELHSRLSATEFTGQLAAAHEYGTSASKANVYVDAGVWQGLKRSISNRETVSHHELVSSDTIIAGEKFIWAVENGKAKLVSYEFKHICDKPCSVGIGR